MLCSAMEVRNNIKDLHTDIIELNVMKNHFTTYKSYVSGFGISNQK